MVLVKWDIAYTNHRPEAPGGLDGKESACSARGPGFSPWVGKIPWRRAWQPTPEFWPGESPWTEEPGGLQSTGSQRVGHDWATEHTAQPQAWGIISNQKCQFLLFAFLFFSFYSPEPRRWDQQRGLEEIMWVSRKETLHPGSPVSIYYCATLTSTHRHNNEVTGHNEHVACYTKPTLLQNLPASKPVLSLLSRFKITSNISIANPFSRQVLLLCLQGFVSAIIQDSFISAARVFG